jgi:hypothetical protein
MSPRTNLKSLGAALTRLEAASGMGRKNCPVCRWYQRRSGPDPKNPEPYPGDLLTSKCEFCHSEYTTDLTGKSEEEREEIRLENSITLKDEYTDSRASAYRLWTWFQPWQKQIWKKLEEDQKPTDPNARASQKLCSELESLMKRRHKRLQAKYGEDPFPEHGRLARAIADAEPGRRKKMSFYVEGYRDLEWEETRCLISAQLEKIIWGEVWARTAAALEKVEREIEELIRADEAKLMATRVVFSPR